MAYMLVRLQCKYGEVARFSEIMGHLVPILERNGWRLHGAYVNSIGRLNKCYDLWEVPDANGVRSVLGLASQDPEWQQWASQLAEVLEEEELELMEKLPYAH